MHMEKGTEKPLSSQRNSALVAQWWTDSFRKRGIVCERQVSIRLHAIRKSSRGRSGRRAIQHQQATECGALPFLRKVPLLIDKTPGRVLRPSIMTGGRADGRRAGMRCSRIPADGSSRPLHDRRAAVAAAPPHNYIDRPPTNSLARLFLLPEDK